MRKEAIKRFLPFFFKYKGMLILTLISMVLSSVTSAIIPLIIKNVIDTLISTKSFMNIRSFLIIFLVLVVANIVFKLVQIYVGNLTGQKIMKDIRLYMFDKLTMFKLESFSREPSGKIITRITNDVEDMNELLNSGIVSLFADIIFIVLAICFLIYINPLLALVILIPLPVAVVLSLHLGNIIESIYEKVRDAVTKMNIHMQEVLTGLHIVQLFNIEKPL